MNLYLNMSLLLLYGFGCINALEAETYVDELYEKCLKLQGKEAYKGYFELQEAIYRDLLKLGISGVRPLNMDEVLAEAVLATCPQEVKDVISCIEQSVFCDNEKNIILHGMSGTGKSCLAQAIAIKSKTPCLFFDAGGISTECMNSGVQNLNRIFECAKRLERYLGSPCVIIFDELEALTKKHAGKNNNENNILTSFWQELDKLSNSRVIVIGTMNNIEDLPVQITNRTFMIEIPLPTLEDRETILSFYLKAKQDKYQLIYPTFVIAGCLAGQTVGFSGKDLQNVVTRATKQAILAPDVPDRSNKIVKYDDFVTVVNQIKKDPKRQLEREIGTWEYAFKQYFSNPRIVFYVVTVVASLVLTYNNLTLQRESITLQKEIMAQVKKVADR